MTSYDGIARANADDECRAWVRKLISSTDEIVAFVDNRLDGKGDGKYLGFLRGSFNLSFHIGFGERRPGALIRFPKPGHISSSWRAEKVANEVSIIEYLREHTTIPLPHIRCWGSLEESPQRLGPFIIMDFIQGTRLSTFLEQPTEDDQVDMILNPTIDEDTLDTIYVQLADYMLQISRLEFHQIGAISKDASETWTVTGRPLTYNMNELASCTGYPLDQFPTTRFDRASEFFQSIARQHLVHLETQRNLADDEANARKRFIARHRFAQLIPKYCIDDAGPFKVFCDDMQPANMLIDPDTLRITAVFDFEFTNSMPAQFIYDPPWWLLLRGPDMWLEHYGMDEFLARYVPRMEQFLRAMERVEAKLASTGGLVEQRCLSARMRDSWLTGRFWFNYAARTSLDIDDIYWHALHDQTDGDGVDLFDEMTRVDMKRVVRLKMEQRKFYQEEYAIRFPKKKSR